MYRGPTLTFIFCAVLCWGHVLVHGQSVPVKAAEFFTEIEQSVRSIADSALRNYKRRQELGTNCNTNTGCSSFACKPLQLYTNTSECVAVPGDGVCAAVGGDSSGCKNITLSTASYVRIRGFHAVPSRRGEFRANSKTTMLKLVTQVGRYPNILTATVLPDPPDSFHKWECIQAPESKAADAGLLPPRMNESKLTCAVEVGICSQKSLDQAFEQVYVNDSGSFNKIAWSLFGASNGVFRIYPGLELPPENCRKRTYDPRKRPWYKAVTDVKKQVVVLVDKGGPMAQTLSLEQGNSFRVLEAALAIVQEFLDTLNLDDIVSIYSFNSAGANMIGKQFQMSKTDVENVATLASLKKAIQGITVTSIDALANLTAALETVLLDGGFRNSTEVHTSLKIILIITAGELAEGPGITIPSSIIEAATTNKVRTFIYHLNQSSREEVDASNLADLQSVACSLGGSYNQIPRTDILDDPLSALVSFYSYVATLRFSLDGQRTMWVPSYDAFSGVGQVMAVVYPVFDGDFLVGVAAIDLLTSVIQDNWPGAITVWSPPNIIHDQGSPINCSVSLTPDPFLCQEDTNSARGLCLDSSFTFANTQLDYAARTCCDGGCLKPPLSDGSASTADIVGGTVGAAVGVFILIIFLYWCCHWKKEATRSPSIRSINTVQSLPATPVNDNRSQRVSTNGTVRTVQPDHDDIITPPDDWYETIL